jgi:XRE family transcriptional regulator, regulator of sulfur utilization
MNESIDGVLSGVDEGADIRARVAENMRRARLARGMSLRDMAAQTGLSKALMSQIERGVANPTISTLTLIASALDISFSDLTRSTLIEPQVVRAAQQPVGTEARMLFSMPERHRFDVSEGHIEPGDRGVMSDHGTGSLEYGYVVKGKVELVVGDQTLLLSAGDAVHFSSASPHVYRALDEASTVITVVAYGHE